MELHKEFIESMNVWHIWCDEGYWITTYQDGEDILDYVSYKTAYCPQNTDFSKHRVITDLENDVYLRLQEEASRSDEPTEIE